MSKYAFLKYWLPPVMWAAVIFAFSSRPTATVSEIYWSDFFFKKFIHLVEYGILATLLYRGLINSKMQKTKAGYLSILLSFLYGASDEFHQSLTPGRDPTLRDVIIDTVGAGLAIYFLWKWTSKLPKALKMIMRKLELT